MLIGITMVIILLMMFGCFSEITAIILIFLSISFFADYSTFKENKVEKYCIYFPETEICKAIDKNPGYLTKKQKDKMIQRVQEEDNKRKNLKKIQDIEID